MHQLRRPKTLVVLVAKVADVTKDDDHVEAVLANACVQNLIRKSLVSDALLV
jgi:hypothetical protein